MCILLHTHTHTHLRTHTHAHTHAHTHMHTHTRAHTHTHAVLGPVDPSNLGVTLTHEHILLEFTEAMTFRIEDYVSDNLTDLDFQMNNLGKIRHYPYDNYCIISSDIFQEINPI